MDIGTTSQAITTISSLQIILAIVGSGFLSTLITLFGNWLFELHRESREEKRRIHKMKEDAYEGVMLNIDFIYQANPSQLGEKQRKKDIFLKDYRIMFLFSDDSIIQELNNILDCMTSETATDTAEMERKKNTIAKAMIELRKQTVRNTKLNETDFRHIT